MSRIVSFFVLIGIILVIGFFFFRVMAPFLVPMFLAALLVVIFHPLHVRVVRWCRNHNRLASAVTTGLIALIVLVPLVVVLFLAAAQGSTLVARLNMAQLRDKVSQARDRFSLLRMPHAAEIRSIDHRLQALATPPADTATAAEAAQDLAGALDTLERIQADQTVTTDQTGPQFDAVREALLQARQVVGQPDQAATYHNAMSSAAAAYQELKLGLCGGEFGLWVKERANPTEEDLQQVLHWALEEAKTWLFSVSGRTTALVAKMVIGLVIMIVSAYFFLAEGPAMVQTIMRLSPLDDRYEQELLSDFTNVSRAVVMATLLSALAQAVLAGCGFAVLGFHSVLLLTLLTGTLALIPFVGAAAVWLPAAVWLYFVDQRPMAAVLFAIYGLAVVSSVDNLIKTLTLHGQSRLHPLLALLSVLGGVSALGPIGILVGPMLVAFLQTLLNILHRELVQFDRERRK